MKKFFLFVALPLLIISAFVFSMDFKKATSVKRPNTAAPIGYSEHYAKTLEQFGFVQNENVLYLQTQKHRDYWQKNFKLNFIGDGEIQKFLRDNDFIMGPTSSYLGAIPENSLRQLDAMGADLKNRYPPFIKWENDTRKWNEREGMTFGTVTLGTPSTLSISDGGMATWSEIIPIPKTTELIDGTQIIEGTDKGKTTKTIDTIPLSPQNIFIIAAVDKFDTKGMNLEGRILRNPPRDPIAVAKVLNGYVELVNW